jgi:mRNA-degrading endonuclease RelE of RelBE toxin-antitoxin system
MQTNYKSTFHSDLKKIPQKIRTKIAQLIDFVKNTDSLSKIPKMKKLEGLQNVYRVHVTYRYIVLIEWDKNSQTVIFLSVSSRENAY